MTAITSANVRSLLHYDSTSGIFSWLVRASSRRSAGSIAGCRAHTGYIQIRYGGRAYLAHRVAWLYMTGSWPLVLLDHINRDRADNAWSNLREVGYSENAHNAVRRCGVTGARGVQLSGAKYRARIMVRGAYKELGVFNDVTEAAAVYSKAASIASNLGIEAA